MLRRKAETKQMPRTANQSFLRKPLTWILGNNANLATMRELCLHGGELSAPQLIASTGLAASSTQGALAALVEANIVRSMGSNRVKIYAVERTHPLLSHIEALFAAEDDRYARIRAGITAIARRTPGVAAAWLYGSVARSEDRPASDVDVALLAEGDIESVVQHFREKLGGTQRDLSFRASVVGVGVGDVATMAEQGRTWWTAVLDDAMTLHGPTPRMAMEAALAAA